ncbi:hypothetical protein PCE1_002949 [Barthelona sp. PCE]
MLRLSFEISKDSMLLPFFEYLEAIVRMKMPRKKGSEHPLSPVGFSISPDGAEFCFKSMDVYIFCQFPIFFESDPANVFFNINPIVELSQDTQFLISSFTQFLRSLTNLFKQDRHHVSLTLSGGDRQFREENQGLQEKTIASKRGRITFLKMKTRITTCFVECLTIFPQYQEIFDLTDQYSSFDSLKFTLSSMQVIRLSRFLLGIKSACRYFDFNVSYNIEKDTYFLVVLGTADTMVARLSELPIQLNIEEDNSESSPLDINVRFRSKQISQCFLVYDHINPHDVSTTITLNENVIVLTVEVNGARMFSTFPAYSGEE